MLEKKSNQQINAKVIFEDKTATSYLSKPKSSKTREDQNLVRRAVENNDQAAYAKLLERYRNPIHFMIYQMVKNKEDAEDLTIEALGKAFNKIEKYKPKYAFSTWVFKIATNTCIDFIRKKKIPKESLNKCNSEGEGYEFDPKSENPDPEERYIIEQRKLLAKEVVNRLPEHYKQLIELRFFKELSYKEISELLEMPQGTIKAQVFRAKELLFNILKNRKKDY